MTLSFRAMTTSDVDAVLEVRLSTIENAVTLDELARDYGVTPASTAAAMAADVAGWLCEDEGVVVGFAMGDRSNGEVLVVAVRPALERRGIGGRLLALVEAWLFASGHDEIWLKANPDPSVRAYGFYRHRGWRATGTMIGNDEVMKRRRPRLQACGPSIKGLRTV